MAKDKAAKDKSKKSGVGTLAKVMMPILSLVGIVLFKQAFLLLMIGMLPTVVTAITDRVRGRALFQTVLSFNFSGALYFFMQMIGAEHGGSGVSAILKDGSTWLSIYGMAGLGYLVYYSAPYAAYAALRTVGQGSLMRLRNGQQRLLRDWGESVREGIEE